MNVREMLRTIRLQLEFKRTPSGRSISPDGEEAILAMISDEKNYNLPVLQCENCGIIMSNMLVDDGCPNCNGINMVSEIDPSNII